MRNREGQKGHFFIRLNMKEQKVYFTTKEHNYATQGFFLDRCRPASVTVLKNDLKVQISAMKCVILRRFHSHRGLD